MKPSLLIMAAGMGSRYGGLKQMEGFGPNGETLLDYSVYDAIKAGFGKVVFVIRHDIEDDFKKIVGKKWESKISVCYVFQELSMVSEGFRIPEKRQKPWGTGHAIWVAQGAIHEPFAAINADDYYGRNSFKVLADFLKKINPSTFLSKDPKKLRASRFAMVGFTLAKTLSEHGTVSRGVCEVGMGRYLKKVVERTHIARQGKGAHYLDEKGKKRPLKGNAIVSMNMWGFTPAVFTVLDRKLRLFLEEHGQEEKSEFLIPRVVDEILSAKQATVKVLSSKSPWFGVTYPEDRSRVQQNIQSLIQKKVYPPKLWDRP